jgi:hypothetical protein
VQVAGSKSDAGLGASHMLDHYFTMFVARIDLHRLGNQMIMSQRVYVTQVSLFL